MKMMVIGCGFVASHCMLSMLPHVDHFVLIDFDSIEKGNYESLLCPKMYDGKRKVTAFANMIQLFSNTPVTPVNMKVRNPAQLAGLPKPDFLLCCVDNIPARIVAKQFVDEHNIPSIFTGVSDQYIHIDWGTHVHIPEETQELRDRLRTMHDVCERLEFRWLGVTTADFVNQAFTRYLRTGKRQGFLIHITTEGLRFSTLER